ncbi:Phosphotransferase enzyme family [Chryseobacterium nakagawai]|uniref:Aminoglycoside phosphotransferase family protein n=1 Tax=Chryseobacterium nakagawai TaxID=1241982 RepID=A0AAD1DQV7_CHRNA|nr:aminoglycoside phosphotransferase family protein [Chryseobacterium nakagawai]AZA90229.1 aminoglycoside phosphotransferase family protein [Chryseobacterium nakagawai]VEH21701.1 Phosphotransferase enzyme family [Chryseobacterium nakagawai]
MEINNIVTQFINTVNYTLSPINDGLINTTYLLEDLDQQKRFILQKINQAVFKQPEVIINNHIIINKLLEKGNYPLQYVIPISSLSGNLIVKDKNEGSWRMTAFIEDTQTFFKIPDPETAYTSAKAIGCFLSTINAGDIPDIQTPLPDFVNFEKRILDYKAALQTSDQKLKANAAAEIEFTNQLLSLPQQWIAMVNNLSLPQRIIHGDPNVRNILFKESKPHAIIDLDTIMISTLLYDFGDIARSYTNNTVEDDRMATENFNAEIYQAVKEGFLSELKETLVAQERENLDYAAQVVIYIQAVRFLTDYLNGSTYYSIQHPEHNLDRTKNQLELLKGLREYLGYE